MTPRFRRLSVLSAALLLVSAAAVPARPAARPVPEAAPVPVPVPAGADRSPSAAIHGIWRNPYNSVDVRIEDCAGQGLCGVVVSATAEAISDAREAGYPDLIGMQLMRNYRADGPRRWSGTVFVPDMGHSFSSHIVLIDPGHARIAGCLWHQYFCQSQIWRRL